MGGDIETNPGPTNNLVVATLNVTSLDAHFDVLRDVPAHVVGLQETCSSRRQQEEVDWVLRKGDGRPQEWAFLWGKERPPRRSKNAPSGNIACGQRGGGVATMVRQPCVSRAVPNSAITAGFEDGRVMHSMVALGSGATFLHVFVVYAHSGCDNKTVAAREALLNSVLFEAQAQVGGAPAVVLGDLNTDVARSPTLRRALENEWVDAAVLQATRSGGDPPPTYTSTRASSRIDYVLMNRIAAQSFVSCSTSLAGVPNHSLVSVTLDSLAFAQETLRYKVPRAIPAPPRSPDADETPPEPPDLAPFYDAVKREAVEDAWMILSGMCERHLLDGSEVAASEERSYLGRGAAREPQRVRVAAPSSATLGTVATAKELRYSATISRMEHYVRARSCVKSGPGAVSGQLVRCWRKCRNVLRELPQECGVTSHLLGSVPDVATVKKLLHAVRGRLHDINREACKARKQRWRGTVRQMFASDRKSLVTVLKGSPGQAADTVKKGNGELTAKVSEMDAILMEAWAPIHRMYTGDRAEPEFAPFAREYDGLFEKHPMQVEDVSGSDLLEMLKRRKKKSAACGVDGWRMDELQRLPLPLMDGFAAFFNLVERTGKWPKGLLTALVSLIPKSEDLSPTNLRPITVTSAVYRLWACRRLIDIMKWQETWALDTQHGFRQGHRCEDVLNELTTLIEETLLDDSKQLYLLALDFQKCFDRVPQKLVLELAEAMGLHQRILRPLKTMYSGLKRRFKLPLGVGGRFEVTNGILQGCPISVILINALLSVMFKAVDVRVPSVSSQSFADDGTLVSQEDEASVQQAVDVVVGFCNITGMALNVKKTVAMGIPRGSSGFRRRHPYVGQVRVQDNILPTETASKILGAKACVSDKVQVRRNDARLESHKPLLMRLPTSPLSTRQRAEIVASNVVSSTVSGGAFAPLSKTATQRLRSRLTTGILGVKHPSRSVGAMLTILHKAHRVDPAIANSYRILCNLFDTCVRIPHMVDRMNRIAVLYEDHPTLSSADALGPVGIAISVALPAAGLEWGDDIRDCAIGDMCLAGEPRSSRNHALRDNLRRQGWKALAKHRPSFSGIENGVDYDRTNALRLETKDGNLSRALTVVLTGGVFFATRWGRNGAYVSGRRATTDETSDSSSHAPSPSPAADAAMEGDEEDEEAEEEEECEYEEEEDEEQGDADLLGSQDSFDWDIVSDPAAEEADVRDPKLCVHCDGADSDTPDHLWWACSAFDSVRSQPQYEPLLQLDRSGWPPCLARYGVVPEGFQVDETLLHTLMGRIVLKRWELEAKMRRAGPLVHPWTAALSWPAEAFDFDVSSIPEKPAARLWPYSAASLRAILAWLAALQWTKQGTVSNIELALDFEIFTGKALQPSERSARTSNPAMAERGNLLWTMMGCLKRLCDQLSLPTPWPARREDRVGSLCSVGAGEVWGGMTPRPVFAGGAETIAALEASAEQACAAAGVDADGNIVRWGTNVFPDYTGIPRTTRASQWDGPRPPPPRSAIPVPVPRSLASTSLGPRKVCNAHSKPKCDECDNAKRNYALTIAACCRVHHHHADGLKVMCCETHHMTRCGTCANVKTCCAAGHHGRAPRVDQVASTDDDSSSCEDDSDSEGEEGSSGATEHDGDDAADAGSTSEEVPPSSEMDSDTTAAAAVKRTAIVLDASDEDSMGQDAVKRTAICLDHSDEGPSLWGAGIVCVRQPEWDMCASLLLLWPGVIEHLALCCPDDQPSEGELGSSAESSALTPREFPGFLFSPSPRMNTPASPTPRKMGAEHVTLDADESSGSQPDDARLAPPADTAPPPAPSPAPELVLHTDLLDGLQTPQSGSPPLPESATQRRSPSPCVGRRLPFSPSLPSESSVPRAQKRVAPIQETGESALGQRSFNNRRVEPQPPVSPGSPISASSLRPDEDSIMPPSELASPLPLSPAPSLVVDDSPGFQPVDTRLSPHQTLCHPHHPLHVRSP